MTPNTTTPRIPPAMRHWHRNLALKRDGKDLVGIHDGDPHPGFYRAKRRGGWVGAFIRYNSQGQLICRIGDDMAEDLIAVWLDLAYEPIDEQSCNYFFAHGRWPGEEAKPVAAEGEGLTVATTVGAQPSPSTPPQAVAPVIGHNGGPSLLEEMKDAADSLRGWLKTIGNKITDQAQVQTATNKVGVLRDLSSKASKAHEIEKAPHLEAGRAVDKKYNPSIKTCDEAVKHLRTLIAAFKQAELDAAEAARRKIEEAHAKKVAKAEAKGKTPPPPPNIENLAPAPQTKIQSDTGRALSFRQEAVLEIDDLGALFDRYQNHSEVAELFLKLARRDWKETGSAPQGTKIVQVAKVA